MTPNLLLKSSLVSVGELGGSESLWHFLKRECFERFNVGGLLVQIYEAGKAAVTGTLLIDFCVTLSCVTAVTDNTFCHSCYFPSCYCVVLQYPAPVSDTPFLMRSAWRFFCLTRTEYSSSNRQVNH